MSRAVVSVQSVDQNVEFDARSLFLENQTLALAGGATDSPRAIASAIHALAQPAAGGAMNGSLLEIRVAFTIPIATMALPGGVAGSAILFLAAEPVARVARF